jgi:hypothetical protein
MARPLRIEAPGATYHITSRGNERRDIFQTDEDRQAFLKFLGMAVRRFRWSITAWVLMTNHFHLMNAFGVTPFAFLLPLLPLLPLGSLPFTFGVTPSFVELYPCALVIRVSTDSK